VEGVDVAGQSGNGAGAGWTVLLLLGVLLNGIGLIGGIPLLPLIGFPLGVVGLIGVLAAKRKAKS
jgi:hypothetical protein